MYGVFEIQGGGESSPVAGRSVVTKGNVVTAVGVDGFFMQTPTSSSDGDPATSDGVFVACDAPPTVSVGDLVDVTGTVEEFHGFTRFSPGATVRKVGVGEVPVPVAFGSERPSPDPASPSCAIEFECYEGMLVHVAHGTVAGPSQAFQDDPMAEMFVTPTSTRSFREAGRLFPGEDAGPEVPIWDGNPEVFELDPDRLGLPNESLVPGSAFSATGVLGYEYGNYELWPVALDVKSHLTLPRPVREKRPEEVTVGSLNLLNLCEPGHLRCASGRNQQEFAAKLAKLSLYIRDVLRSPDILGVQEVASTAELVALAERVGADDPAVAYSAHLREGNDHGGIDVGFLVRAGVDVKDVSQLFKDTEFGDDALHDRPPLLLKAVVEDFPINVLVVHNKSFLGIGTEKVRKKRLLQAMEIARSVQSMQESHFLIVGDFNAYQFTDGLVDVVGQISGTAVAQENLYSEDNIVDPALYNTLELLEPAERYSYLFPCDSRREFPRDCEAQALDHALVNEKLRTRLVEIQFGRGNADARRKHEFDTETSLYSSDHDGLVVYLSRVD